MQPMRCGLPTLSSNIAVDSEMRKICLIGCGNIGGLHARNLSGSAELHFCSRSRRNAERFNDAFGGNGAFDRFDDVLEAAEVEAVVIASPPAFHREQIVRSLEAGKAVLVEKPMCISQEEVDEIGTALREAPDGLLMVAENYYYKPLQEKIREFIKDGSIGKVESVSARKLFAQDAPGWKSNYGALLEGGIHFVAQVSDIFDAAPRCVAAEFPGFQEGEAERSSITRLEYPDGSRAELRYSWNTKALLKGLLQHSRIRGTEGRISFESNGMYGLLSAKGKSRPFFPEARDLMGYRRMMRDFLHCLEDRTRKPYSDFSRAKRDLQIVFEAYRSLPGTQA